MEHDLAVVGVAVPRLGLAEKVRGEARYTADLKRPGMLYGRVLRSPHPHARIVHIDTSEAERIPGVHAVLTYQDVPQRRLDADLLPLEPVLRFVGDEVALVAADSEAVAEDALRLIRVEYEVLAAVFDAEEALQPGAPLVHSQGNLVGDKTLVVERGSVAQGFAAAARVFEDTFHTQMHAPVGMETRAALAEWDGDRLTVWKTSRAVHASDRRTLASVLDLPLEQVRVICPNMGGGFGNKDEGRLAVLVALLARKAGRPVRVEYSRTEEFVAGRNRQEAHMRLKIGIQDDGTPLAIDLHATMNAGAFVASGMNVTRRVGQGALYLYTCPNARFEGTTVYTNRPAGGSFRGLGAPLGTLRTGGLNRPDRFGAGCRSARLSPAAPCYQRRTAGPTPYPPKVKYCRMSPSKAGYRSPATTCGSACWLGRSASAGASVDNPTAALPACCGVAWAWPWAFIRGDRPRR